MATGLNPDLGEWGESWGGETRRGIFLVKVRDLKKIDVGSLSSRSMWVRYFVSMLHICGVKIVKHLAENEMVNINQWHITAKDGGEMR